MGYAPLYMHRMAYLYACLVEIIQAPALKAIKVLLFVVFF